MSRKSLNRPYKLTMRDMRHLECLLNKDYHTSLTKITNNVANIEKVSTRTVRNAFQIISYKSVLVAKEPFMNKKHKVDRLEFA